jgi:hypothetical protein
MGSNPAISTSTPTRQASVWPLGIALGLVFALPTYAFALSNNEYVTGSTVVAFVPIMLWLAASSTPTSADLTRIFAITMLIVLPLIASMALHADEYGLLGFLRTMLRVVACGLYVLIGALLIYHPRREALAAIAFGVLGLALAFLFVFMATTRPQFHWGRWMPGGLHPNWWGELFLVMTITLVFVRPRRLIFYGALPLILVGLFLVQARGALLSTVIVIAFAILDREGLRRLLLIGAVGLTVLLPVVAAVDVLALEGRLVGGLVAFVANDVLLLNDPYRGVDSGLTGRDTGFVLALREFAGQPLTGAGFGLGNQDVRELAGGDIHNGHLALLLELGLVFYTIFFVIMFGALVRSFAQGHWGVFGAVLAYLAFVTLAPRSINLSVLSMIGWIMIIHAWLLPPARVVVADTAETARRLGRRWQGGGATDRPAAPQPG